MAGAEWGIRMRLHQVRWAIRAIDRIPVERTTTYERVQRNGFGSSRETHLEGLAPALWD